MREMTAADISDSLAHRCREAWESSLIRVFRERTKLSDLRIYVEHDGVWRQVELLDMQGTTEMFIFVKPDPNGRTWR